MFGFGPATRIYLAVGATDLRKALDSYTQCSFAIRKD